MSTKMALLKLKSTASETGNGMRDFKSIFNPVLGEDNKLIVGVPGDLKEQSRWKGK